MSIIHEANKDLYENHITTNRSVQHQTEVQQEHSIQYASQTPA